jgi:hypothetical protein
MIAVPFQINAQIERGYFMVVLNKAIPKLDV